MASPSFPIGPIIEALALSIIGFLRLLLGIILSPFVLFYILWKLCYLAGGGSTKVLKWERVIFNKIYKS